MNENEEIAKELEEENKRRERNNQRPLKIDRNQLKGAKVVWTVGAVLVDIATGYAVWQITFWWYGLAWILAGAGGLIYSDWIRSRIGNNFEQKKIAESGLNVSWFAIVFMAVVAGVVYILGFTRNPWIEVLTILATLGLFFYHVYQSYRYNMHDDEYVETNEEARELEEHARELRKIHRAGRRVEGKRKERNTAGEYKQKQGAAFSAAYGKDIETVELQDKNPTQGGK